MTSTYPDFIIVGSMKCGTTSLHYYLANHPHIYMPPEKELDFFIKEKNFHRGRDWYKSRFNNKYKLNGEASPNYTKAHLFRGVPKRLYEQLPNVKLIFLYRDPIKRAYSHYIHNLAIGTETKGVSEGIDQKSNYIKTSLYYWQLQFFLDYFNEDQLLVVNSEELRNNRKKTLREIYKFLDIEYYYDERLFEKKRHQSSKKTKRNLFNSMVLKTKFGDLAKKLVSEDFKNFYRKITEKPLKVPNLTVDQKKKMSSFIEEDFKKFQLLLDKLNQ